MVDVGLYPLSLATLLVILLVEKSSDGATNSGFLGPLALLAGGGTAENEVTSLLTVCSGIGSRSTNFLATSLTTFLAACRIYAYGDQERGSL